MPSHRRFAAFHRTVKGVHERLCTLCQRWLPFTRHYFHQNSKGVLHGQCKACCREKHRRWYADPVNKERAKQRERERYAAGLKPKTSFYKRKRLHTHRGIAKAVSNGVPPEQVLQRIFVGHGQHSEQH